jgi:hypothetical protein
MAAAVGKAPHRECAVTWTTRLASFTATKGQVFLEGDSMKKILLLLAVSGTLTGCISFQNLEKGLYSLHGKKEEVAISIFGIPSSEQNIAGRKVYRWSSAHTAVMAMPTTSYGTGYVGTTPVWGTVNSTSMVPMNFNCTITVVVDPSTNVIVGSEYSGNRGGCKPYIRAIENYMDATGQEKAIF